MPGAITHNGIRYCLVPTMLSQEMRTMEYFPGLPLTAKPRRTGERAFFVDPLGHEVPDAIPVLESEFWAPAETLFTIERWLCYPINFGIFRTLPTAVAQGLMVRSATDWVSGKGYGTYQVNWEGLTISKRYRVLELGVGVAIWPRRALAGWRQFFVLFAPGTKENAKAMPFGGSATSPKLEPIIYSLSGDRLTAGDTKVIYADKAAMCRSAHPPRLIALRTEGRDPEHGVIPLLCGTDGSFLPPNDHVERHRRPLADLALNEGTVDRATTAHIAVDFGTTNTAVAVSLRPNSAGEVLQFSDEVLARKLTDPWLDPAHLIESRFSFFPMNTRPANPLPTVIVEIDPRLEPFPGSQSLPRRSIPGDKLDDQLIQAWVQADHVKQEFKWQQDDAGATLRAAFLEMLARLVGLELRSQPKYQSLRKVQIVFTCPLSFSHEQTESLKRVQDEFKRVLEECGFDVSLRSGLVSESLANLFLLRSAATGIGSESREERHVVIDIGGGSTDISVFTGDGHPLFLDSLYLGGKDFPETLVRRRLSMNGNKSDFAAALQKIFGSAEVSDSENFGRMLQLLLISRIDRDMEAVASSFEDSALRGTPADFLTLLTFSTIYGARMASLGGAINGTDVPEGQDIRVWFVGLGSRLFELSPLRKAFNDRLESARAVLQAGCKKVLPPGARVQFAWRSRHEAKVTVCRGALLVPSDEAALDLQTVYWASFPSSTPSITWHHSYDRARLLKMRDPDHRKPKTDALVECVEASITAVTELLGFRASDDSIDRVKGRVQEDYSRGVGLISQDKKDAPKHPLITATNGMKENMVGVMKRAGGS